jgi:lysophospholipase L1-like esterase
VSDVNKVWTLILAVWISVFSWAGWEWMQASHPSVSARSLDTGIVHEAPSMLQTLKTRASREGSLHYLALGDSVALGKGAPRGYAAEVADRLERHHLPVQLDNQGVSGQTSSQLWEALHKPEMKRKIRQADLITITIGGNDVLKVALKRSQPWEAFSSFDEIRDGFVRHLNQILTLIRQENPTAVVLVTSLYNPVPPDALYFPLTEKLLDNWNTALSQTVSAQPGCIVVQIDDLLRPEHRDWLADQIHPNTRGHRLIATAILNAIGLDDTGSQVADAGGN